MAPTTNTLRKISSPARVMTPSLTLPAVEFSLDLLRFMFELLYIPKSN